ncbi:hypothetical protein TH63_18630 [Rufibacter radiotolerans]|uniref:Lipocalin-like domain-containing protein n=1 Tax=Rufibacter radiotolerans TaxID=1379910 RepID=A0A0H4VTR6_9BACT|nr:hypothetical protein [Rufibacter radiotolerans]AKQ47199.1 hypothetical protein TH63_18630 [Rufibacter radiotolerans]
MNVSRLLGLLLCASFFASCEQDEPTDYLQIQWRFYSSRVLVLGNQAACNYQVKPADMDFEPSASCQDDDVYDFSNGKDLVIYNGAKQCTSTEPATVTKAYERRGDKLTIGGQEYTIVRLTKDTLTVSYCAPLASATGYTQGKVGMKLVRK